MTSRKRKTVSTTFAPDARHRGCRLGVGFVDADGLDARFDASLHARHDGALLSGDVEPRVLAHEEGT